MTECDSCENLLLIRKQRQEIILLTQELQHQEEQINKFHSNNLKLKELLKTEEKKEIDFEKKCKSFTSEIANLNENLKQKNDELEQIKQKQAQKDSYIQTQAKKIFQLQTEIDKINQELNNSIKYKKETRSENTKLQFKIKEQSNRILELKEKNEELVKALESRNSLIKASADHIKLLERNLVDFLALMKTNKTDASTDTTELFIDPTLHKNEPKIINNSNEHKLTTLLQDLKETWLESNLKYEEVKNIVFNELKDKECRLVNNLESIDRMFTSSPIP